MFTKNKPPLLVNINFQEGDADGPATSTKSLGGSDGPTTSIEFLGREIDGSVAILDIIITSGSMLTTIVRLDDPRPEASFQPHASPKPIGSAIYVLHVGAIVSSKEGLASATVCRCTSPYRRQTCSFARITKYNM